MTKSELIDKLYSLFPNLGPEKAHTAVNLIVDKMAESLLNGERIEIRRLGSFALRHHKPRAAHNPKTGQKLVAKEKYSVHFKPSKELKEAINEARSKGIPPGEE
jgi:integration host factor subunit beta